MAVSRFGVPIPTNADDPNNFGGLLQPTIESLEELGVPVFADSGERDSVWPDAGVGAACFLRNPSGPYFKYAIGWRPLTMPGPGDTTTVMHTEIAQADATFTVPVDADFGCSTTIPVPAWATSFGGSAQASAFVQAGVDANAGDGTAGAFGLYLNYSTDGGSTFTRSSGANIAGKDVHITCTLSATDNPNSINVLGVTSLNLHVIVGQRISAGGLLQRPALRSRVVWLVTFTPAAFT